MYVRYCTKTFIPTIAFKSQNNPVRWEVGSQFRRLKLRFRKDE